MDRPIHAGAEKEEFSSSYLYAVCKCLFGIPCRLYDVEEIYINVLVPFILKKLPVAL